MTIYTRNGAPLEIVARNEAEDRPTFVQAKLTGPYPDGSGADQVGELLYATDRTARGWFKPFLELRADKGISEIVEAVNAAPMVDLTESQRRKLERYYR